MTRRFVCLSDSRDRLVVVRGGAFSFRTFHHARALPVAGVRPPFTLDQDVTMTMPAIDGLKRKMRETMRVDL